MIRGETPVVFTCCYCLLENKVWMVFVFTRREKKRNGKTFEDFKPKSEKRESMFGCVTF